MVCQKHAREYPETIAYKRIRLSERNNDVFNNAVNNNELKATESNDNHGRTVFVHGLVAEGGNNTCHGNESFCSEFDSSQNRMLLDDSSTICSVSSIASPEGNVSTRGSSITSQLPSYVPNAQTATVLQLKDRWNPERELVTDQVCFGMLASTPIHNLQSTWPDPWATTLPVYLDTLTDPLRVMSLDGAYLGTLDVYYSKLFRILTRKPDLELQSSINIQQMRAKRSSKETNLPRIKAAGLSVILYGPVALSELLSEYLTRCGEYLQMPLQCNRNVRYRNPQSLLRGDHLSRMTFQLQEVRLPLEVEAVEQNIDLSAALETEQTFLETEPSAIIKTSLYSHQKQALSFMLKRERGWDLRSNEDDIWKSFEDNSKTPTKYYNALTGFFTRKPPPEFYGGILADSMGLGKSLTMISLFASDYPRQDRGELRTGIIGENLLIVPLSLLRTWEEQLSHHLHPGTLTWYKYHRSDRSVHGPTVLGHDIVITTYDVVAAQWRNLEKGMQPLYSRVWRRIILDEAHEIRTSTTVRAKAVCGLKGKARWAMTGTPIQNRPEDLASLLDFLKVFPDSNVGALKNMLRCTATNDNTKRMIRPLCLRRTKKSIPLPVRSDEVHVVHFDEEESAQYSQLNSLVVESLKLEAIKTGAGSYMNILTKINSLRQVCNLGTSYGRSQAPFISQTQSNEDTIRELFNSMLSAEMAICSKCMLNLATGDNVTESPLGDGDDFTHYEPQLSPCGVLLCPACSYNRKGSAVARLCRCLNKEPCRYFPVSLSSPSSPPSYDPTARLPVKMRALQRDLVPLPDSDKSIIFSCWTSTLDIVELAVREVGLQFARVDGTMRPMERQQAFDAFQEHPQVRVILISLRCGSTGLNLTTANHVFLMEPQWNPMLEEQALDRVYRIGQTKEVTTVRYIVKGTLEESIRHQQIQKRRLAEEAFSPSRTRTDWIQQIRAMLSNGQ